MSIQKFIKKILRRGLFFSTKGRGRIHQYVQPIGSERSVSFSVLPIFLNAITKKNILTRLSGIFEGDCRENILGRHSGIFVSSSYENIGNLILALMRFRIIFVPQISGMTVSESLDHSFSLNSYR